MHTIDDTVSNWKLCLKHLNSIRFPNAGNAGPRPSDTHGVQFSFEVERNRLMQLGIAGGLSSWHRATQSVGGDFPITGPLREDHMRAVIDQALEKIASLLSSESSRKQLGLTALDSVRSASSLQKEGKRKSFLRDLFKRSPSSSNKATAESSTTQSSSSSSSPNSGSDGAAIWEVRNVANFRTLIATAKDFNDFFEQLLVRDADGYAWTRSVRLPQEDVQSVSELREQWESSFGSLVLDNQPNIDTTMVPPAARTATQSTQWTSLPPDSQLDDLNNKFTQMSTGGHQVQPTATEREIEKRRMKELESSTYRRIFKELKGVLNLRLEEPNATSPSASIWVEIEGHEEQDQALLLQTESNISRSIHPAFDLYREKPFTSMKSDHSDTDWPLYKKSKVLLDPEADPNYEHRNPGTVTVQGFALEVWNYDELYGPPRHTTSMTPALCDMPKIGGSKLLRRIQELQDNSTSFGDNPRIDEANIHEFFGILSLTCFQSKDPIDTVSAMSARLDRKGAMFADFTRHSSISMARMDTMNIWNFLWQIILSRELAFRLDYYGFGLSYNELTPRVLASLIVQDLWLRNVSFQLIDLPVARSTIKPATQEEESRAAQLKREGDEATRVQYYDKAIESYAGALETDPSNPAYLAASSAALLEQGQTIEALKRAYMAASLQPASPEGWMRMGAAQLQRGYAKQAREAFQKSIEASDPDSVPDELRRYFEAADALVKAEAEAVTIRAEQSSEDQQRRSQLRKSQLDRDFDTTLKTVVMYSNVHQQQLQGLLLFADRMSWPYMEELRAHAQGAYERILNGELTSLDVHDWLFGLTLPGHYMSFKIMSALVACTPSIQHISTAPTYQCGLCLPGRYSYWRLRTVLGSVLAALPGVVSLCGWVGRCPAAEFDPPSAAARDPRHIRLQARPVAPSSIAFRRGSYIHGFWGGFGSYYVREDAQKPRKGEDLGLWAAQMVKAQNWVDLPPPQRDPTVVTLKRITLRPLPLEQKVQQQLSDGRIQEAAALNMTEYRASLAFALDGKDEVTFTMSTNPVFVTLPPCHPPENPDTALSSEVKAHKVHVRELMSFASVNPPLCVAELHGYEDDGRDTGAEDEGDNRTLPLVINATGTGGELIARAWCAERGRSAAIRKPGGPCFVCALEGSAKAGLGVDVLIWSC